MKRVFHDIVDALRALWPKHDDPDMKPHYDFSKGVRGKHAGRFRADAKVTIIESKK